MTEASQTHPTPTEPTGPPPADVAALSELLDATGNFPSNDQRARYLLSSDWMRSRISWTLSLRDQLEGMRSDLDAIEERLTTHVERAEAPR